MIKLRTIHERIVLAYDECIVVMRVVFVVFLCVCVSNRMSLICVFNFHYILVLLRFSSFHIGQSMDPTVVIAVDIVCLFL